MCKPLICQHPAANWELRFASERLDSCEKRRSKELKASEERRKTARSEEEGAKELPKPHSHDPSC